MMKTPTTASQESGGESTTLHANGRASTEELRARIEKLAYELYQRRGGQEGCHEQDWLEAERLTLDSRHNG